MRYDPSRAALGARSAVAAVAALALVARAQTPQPPPAPPQQPSEVTTTITSEAGAPPRFAVPDFIALSPDAETVAAAKTIGQVLWDDLNFEREFTLMPRDTYRSIPAATSFADVPFDRWRELNADGLIIGTVQKTGVGHPRRGAAVQRQDAAVGVRQGIRRGGGQPAPLRAHDLRRDPPAAARRCAASRGRSWPSTRTGTASACWRTVESRGVKEIYISDYDGANQRPRHHQPHAEHHAALVARRPVDRLHVLPARTARTSSSRTSTRARSRS